MTAPLDRVLAILNKYKQLASKKENVKLEQREFRYCINQIKTGKLYNVNLEEIEN